MPTTGCSFDAEDKYLDTVLSSPQDVVVMGGGKYLDTESCPPHGVVVMRVLQ